MTAKLYTEHELSIDAYHAFGNIKKLGEDAVLSKSMLAVFEQCPARFHDEYILGNKEPSTAGMNLGKAVHLYALQPRLFDAEYYVMPLKDDGKQIIRNESHAAYKEQIALAAGREILQPSDMAQIKAMSAALKKDKRAMLLLDKPGKIEASIFWTDPQTGLKFRCRPDFLPDDGILVDLKTTASADDDGFHRIAFNKHYDLSVALTARGYKALTGEWPKEYAFLLVEDKRPHVIEGKLTFVKHSYPMYGMELHKSYWEIGEDRLSVLLDYYMSCKKSGVYPGYNREFMPMLAPDWQMRKLYKN